MPRYPHAFGGGSSAPTPPTGLDRLQQLQDLDTADAHSNALQQQSLAHMLTSLYGIRHEQQFAPEQLRALSSSTNARDFETERGTAMLPEQLRGARAENASREFGNTVAPQNNAAELALKGAQTGNTQAQADMTRKYDTGNAYDLFRMHAGGMPDEDYYTGLSKLGPYAEVGALGLKRISDAKALREKGRAEDEARTNPVHAPELSIPPYAQNDPQIQEMLRSQSADKDFYKHGGGLDTELQRNAVRRQVHPGMQFLNDLMSLYR